MTTNQKFLAGIILGAAAGTALALFFSSDKGKEVLADAKDTAEKLGEDIKSHLEVAEDKLNGLVQKGKEFVADLEQKVKDATTA